jgi:hypothetical protein
MSCALSTRGIGRRAQEARRPGVPLLGEEAEAARLSARVAATRPRERKLLRALDLPVDFLGTSDGWGAEKPSPGLLERIITEMRVRAERDRVRGRPVGQRHLSCPRRWDGRGVRARGPWVTSTGHTPTSPRRTSAAPPRLRRARPASHARSRGDATRLGLRDFIGSPPRLGSAAGGRLTPPRRSMRVVARGPASRRR